MKEIVQKRVIKIIMSLFAFFVVYMLNRQFDFFSIPQSESNMKSDLFDIITVCSVFAGFSFTVLGLLISLSSTKTMEVLKETTIMLRHCNIVADSIVMFIISTLISLMIVFVAYSKFVVDICSKFLLFDLHEAIRQFLYMICVGYLVYGIILFIISIKNMIVIMKKIFEEDIAKGKKKAEDFMKIAEKQAQDLEKIGEEDFEKDTFRIE